ncbi:pentapeptide repeat-containing protein [Campylobacter sp. CNRCH_2013_0855]|uniref:pentapeptide repeat-containing protein n=1 Tax=Campylobacter sp. CNRCH_2013_0855 TaxID=2911600 RepID=UPI0021E6749E|nr:pentapeptide repeat-containing protein [Campylobacter sp. CNRCH_2013_0855]MCV3551655.1 pentapeptide repeat-containing protein [Campylobacter sp. CNRCH_2013_0855]
MQKLLESYGILVQENIKDTNVEINENTITICNTNINKIDLSILEQKQINEITIANCEIDYIYFANDNNVELFFIDCVFKSQITARRSNFHKKVSFEQCIFEKRIDFSRALFSNQVNFSLTKFECEARFIETKFSAKYTNQENIENNFREVVFKDKAFFDSVKFKARVSFEIARFESEARFVEAKFLAEYTSQENIENNFRETFFKGKVSFDSVEFKAKISFSIAQFESETSFSYTNFNHVVIFFHTNFKDSILFRNTSFFKNIIIFSEVKFNNIKFISDKKLNETNTNDIVDQIYHFQDTTFKGIVNFENMYIKDLNFKNVIFNNIVVFDNTTLNSKPKFINCTFSNQFNIKQEHIQYNFKDISKDSNDLTKLPNLENKNKNDDFTKPANLRDLFRKLKSNRIAHHNLIDASELRAQELYARELELKHQKDKTLKEKVEQWQLIFYRNLCDHHTDLVLNLKWLATTITVFLCLYFFSKYGLNFQHFINEYNNNSIIKYININFIYKFESYNGFIFIFYTYILIFMLWNVFRIFFSFAVILCCIINQPKLIFGIANLIGDNSYNAFENLLITLYTLIVGLIIFSLQKTARKNTIIPN